MDLEVEVVVSRGTLTLVPPLIDVNIFICKWVFTLNYHLNDTIVCHKAFLVGHNFTKAYDVEYIETLSPIVYLNSVYILLPLTVNQALSLH